VRLFNPFPAGRYKFITRFAASALDFSRVHRRMLIKLFIADGVVAVAGGRNIADEYFMVSAGANFIDLDTLVAGALVPRLSELFDQYWNSERVFPVTAIVTTNLTEADLRSTFDMLTGPLTTPDPEPPPPNDLLGYSPIVEELAAGMLGLVWANARAYADAPDKVIGRVYTYALVPLEDVDSVRYNVIEYIRRARSEVVVSSPYLIPGPVGIETLREVRERDVKLSILTNSLAATDEPLVHTGYRRYRPQMLALDVELYELSPIRVNRSLRLGRFGTSTGRLHAKSAVIDRERLFIGSMNFDPRSDRHNTELGLFIDSPTLALQTLKLIDVIKEQGAYRVRMAADGTTIQWVVAGPGGENILVDEPEADFWTRVMLEVFSWLAPEDLL
jgi:putative cardiolipin synthase